MSSTRSPSALVDALDGDRCPFCEDGKLAPGTYKNNDAALCDTCGTPAIQEF